MVSACRGTIFAATAEDTLGYVVPAPQKTVSDVGLRHQRVIVQLLKQVPLVPATLQAVFSHLMQSGVLTTEAVAPDLTSAPETGTSPTIRCSETAQVGFPSRFDQDFERLELLGHGAFGEVWRCRHRLDGCEYAVKAVPYRVGADAGQTEQHVLQEASTWACLTHPNILRYHSSWTQVHQNRFAEGKHNPESSPLPCADELMSALPMGTSGPHTDNLAEELSFEESGGGVVFEASNLAAKPQFPAPQHAAAPPDSVVVKATTAIHRCTPFAHQGKPVVSGCRATLYLQAELCRKDTLMTWIAQRNAAMASGLLTLQDRRRWADRGLDIFRQIVVGLAHLHAHRCAHRDVKPSNILFGCDGSVRIGDFGLAKFLEDTRPLSLQEHNSSSSPQQGKNTLGGAQQQHTRAVGTFSYASPEQLEGRPCSVQTDVYALGIILAELLYPVSTHMERAALLEGLRKDRKILGEVASTLPIAARLAVSMTSPDPMQRPLMCEILEAYPEVEREVKLSFGSETGLASNPFIAAPTAGTLAVETIVTDFTTSAVDGLHETPHRAFPGLRDKAAGSRYQFKKEPAHCSSSTACKSASEQSPLQEEQASQTAEKTEGSMDSTTLEHVVKKCSLAPDAHAASTAPSECWHWPPFALPTPRAAQRARAGHSESDKAAQRHHRRHSVIARQTTATWVPSARETLQFPRFFCVLLCLLAMGTCSAVEETSDTNPLANVLDLMDELKAKIIAEGEAEERTYDEYLNWCQNAVQDSGFAIESATKEKGELEAKMAKLTAEIEEAGTKTEELAAAIASNEADLKSATAIREKEYADFVKSEKELVEVTSALERAISILEKESAKNPASFAQVYYKEVQNVIQSLSLVADAAAFSVVDRQRVFALAQTDEGDEEFGAPVAAAYKSPSGGIIEVLEAMNEKAESQLAELRKAEETAKYNYDILKQSLEAQISADKNDMSEEKDGKAEAEETKAEAEGDLEVTTKELANAKESLATARLMCMKVGADHDMTVKARTEELNVIAEAKKILVETTSGAVEQTYSFVQVMAASRQQTHADLAHADVVVLVNNLAREHRSAALARLASCAAAVLQYGAANGEDPFKKVKSLIQGMITQLEEEAQAEAQEKAYCGKQLSKTKAKKEELGDDLAKLTVKIDQDTSKIAKLKEEVQELESELAALTKLQAEMDKIRQDTRANYMKAKEELELGLEGVRMALGKLREYYSGAALLQDGSQLAALMQQPAPHPAHKKSSGAGQGIISILEVCESDFAENLAKENTEEADAQAEYDKTTQDNKVAKTLKERDVKFKTQGKESAESEHAAVMEYYEKVKERCIAKPETYEERKRRREEEIKGLQQALSILENETAFV